MNPKFWGPSGWIFIHNIAYGYPTNPTREEQKAMINFLSSFQHVLPCKTCSDLYKKDIKLLPPLTENVKNKHLLVKWVNHMHNKVNENLNKPIYSDEEYENYYLNKSKKYNTYSIIILIIVFICVIYFVLQ